MAYTYENETSLMKEGDYEAKIERMEVKTLPSGIEKLAIMYRIRDDVEGQKYGNKCLFEDIFKPKDDPEHFNTKRINQLLGTQDVKDGTVFENINSIINFLVGQCLVLHVVEVFDDYRGENVNKVRYYRSSKLKPKELPTSKPVTEADVVDEDLPF